MRLGFIGARELHTWSGYNNFFSQIQPNINGINDIMWNKISRENVRSFMNTNSNPNSVGGGEGGGEEEGWGLHLGGVNNNNKETSLVQLYGEKWIISNNRMYENIIKCDEF